MKQLVTDLWHIHINKMTTVQTQTIVTPGFTIDLGQTSRFALSLD